MNMLTLLFAMLSAGPMVSTPKPSGDSSKWITINDYPKDALEQKQAGTVGYNLSVSSNGDVTGCEIIKPSGSSSLDTTTCALLFIRARFTPAADSNGGTITSKYSSKVTWAYPSNIQEVDALKPIKLSNLTRNGEYSSVIYVNKDGMIDSCDVEHKNYNGIVLGPDLCGLFPAGARYSSPAFYNGSLVKRKVTLELSVTDVNVR